MTAPRWIRERPKRWYITSHFHSQKCTQFHFCFSFQLLSFFLQFKIDKTISWPLTLGAYTCIRPWCYALSELNIFSNQGSKLNSADDVTRRMWMDEFNVPFARPGSMFRSFLPWEDLQKIYSCCTSGFAFFHSLLKSVLGKENWSISLRGNPPQGKLFEITQDFQRSLLAPREMDVTVSRCDAPNHFSLIYQITLRNCRESGKPWHILGSSLYFPIFIIPLPVKWWSNVLGWKSATCLRRKTRTCFSRCSLRRRTPARSPTRGRRPSSTATSSTSTTPTTWRFLSSPSIETSCSVFVHWF